MVESDRGEVCREWGGWCSNLVFGSHGLWKYIRRG